MNKSNTNAPALTTQSLYELAVKGTLWEHMPEEKEAIQKYLKCIPNTKVTTRDLRVFESTPVRRALFEMRRVMSTFSSNARAAVQAGLIEAPIAAQALRERHDQWQLILAAFAATRKEADQELVYETVGVITQHGDFDLMQSEKMTSFEEEECDGDDDGMDAYESAKFWDREAQDCDSAPRTQKFTEEEGQIVTALHDAWDVLLLDPARTQWTDFRYSATLFSGMEWPTHLGIWPDFLERFAEAQINMIDGSANAAEREANREKARKRCLVLTTDVKDSNLIHYTRWALSAACRRIWRDINGPIEGRMESLRAHLDRLASDNMTEEAYTSAPTYLTRVVTEYPTAREINLIYDTADEADAWSENWHTRAVTASGSMADSQHGMELHPAFIGMTQYDLERMWAQYQLEQFEEIKEELWELYAILRAWELRAASLWKWSAEQPNRVGDFVPPHEPPVYWNRKGFYLTEEDAITALRAEEEALVEQTKVDELGAFTEAVQKAIELGDEI